MVEEEIQPLDIYFYLCFPCVSISIYLFNNSMGFSVAVRELLGRRNRSKIEKQDENKGRNRKTEVKEENTKRRIGRGTGSGSFPFLLFSSLTTPFPAKEEEIWKGKAEMKKGRAWRGYSSLYPTLAATLGAMAWPSVSLLITLRNQIIKQRREERVGSGRRQGKATTHPHRE